MDTEWWLQLLAHYNWLAALVTLVSLIALTTAGKYIAFKTPALAAMKRSNDQQDKEKMAIKKYPPMVLASQKVGFFSNLFFFVALVPFCVTLETQAPWQLLWIAPLHIVLILMFYDFFYYLMHRFWFHGKGPMRRIHAVHHQARSPTAIDAFYVHPLETFLGLAVFFISIIVMVAFTGPLHVVTLILTFVIYTQINILNHAFVELPYFPFKTINWMVAGHHRHHENMLMGNYATITPLYDKLFGTREEVIGETL